MVCVNITHSKQLLHTIGDLSLLVWDGIQAMATKRLPVHKMVLFRHLLGFWQGAYSQGNIWPTECLDYRL